MAHLPPYAYLLAAAAMVTVASCERPPEHRLQPLSPQVTGVDFANQLAEDDTTNILYNEYLYNGSGVGVGDFDRNGLPDLFFGGNMVSSRLYLQRSAWVFEDVTERVGLMTDSWISGINVGDVNGDGWEDLYLTALNPDGDLDVPNLLYLNQGTDGNGQLSFREVAAEYGLDNPAYSTHSAWFDLEGDGDLDLYLLNNSLEASRKLLQGTDTSGTAPSLDVVYKHTGSPTAPRFERTTTIKQEGWGLGIVPQDFNLDGLTDLYVANDFISDDLLLISDGKGGLRSQTKAAFAHTSKNSMGVDAGDLNNDGFPDVVTADMLPDDNLRQKTMFSDIAFQMDARAALQGYTRQYVRNTLQLSAGDGTYDDLAFLAGIAATDWSWTPLIADLDNNGYRDILISNGYPRDITNRDFVDFAQSAAMFGTDDQVMTNTLEALRELDGVHQPNYVFGNFGDLHFRRTDWLPDAPTYSNGAAYVDLDLDGDLDLVTNNLNEPAGVYRNYSRERQPDSTHYLQLELEGPPANPDALGAKVYLSYSDGQHSYQEQQRQRGYLSTMDATMHFGLGGTATVDTLLIVWPSGRVTRQTGVATDQRLRIPYPTDTTAVARRPAWTTPAPRQASELDHRGPRHRESAYSDFDNHALAVRDRSHDGPALVTLDLTGDGREALIVGGSAGAPTIVYRRMVDSFAVLQVLEETTIGEATALVTLDFDGDGDPDLYVGNGSQEFEERQAPYRDLLYENRGGVLTLTQGVLPELFQVTGAVAVADLENDGDPDLFVGSQYQVGAYPRTEPSVLLVNEGGRRFTLQQEVDAGLVTDAVWTDLNGDGLPDLATVGEYAAPRTYLNRNGTLEGGTAVAENLQGWWYSLTATDLDADGDQDLLAGNLGTNSIYHASPAQPLTLRVADYDDNGRLDPIMMMYFGQESHPVHPRNTLGRQLPNLKKQATTYAEYASWVDAIMPAVGEDGFILSATEFRSVYLENDGNGHFRVRVLPNAAQTAPIRDALATRLPDGRPALLAVQNDYAVEVLGGRLDAGNGFALSIRDGELVVDNHFWSVRGDARSVVALDSLIAVGINDDYVRLYRRRYTTAQLTR